MRQALILMVLMAANAQAGVVERYLEAYFEMYPSRATAAGMHDRDDLLDVSSRGQPHFALVRGAARSCDEHCDDGNGRRGLHCPECFKRPD